MSMPLIGISGSMNDAEKQIFLVRAYMQVLLKAGAVPVLLSPDMDTCAMTHCLNKLDGLMLAGGGDVVPSHFQEEAIPELGETTPERDALELSLLPMAMERQMPVLGICRGVQVMNVALGGNLYQDLPAQYQHETMPLLPHRQTEAYEKPTHTVMINPSSLLHQLVGETEIAVNSMHHQAVKRIAPLLQPVATAPDGVIEALEHPALPFFLGVQWHPERLEDAASRQLFAGFINAAETYRRHKG